MSPSESNERGVALVISLFLMAALSALAVSLMFLSQTETSASRNYKTMSEARYAGEAGVHKAINYLINSYSTPSTTSSYDLTKSPVTCTSGCTHTTTTTCDASTLALAQSTGCIVLAPTNSNYPDSTVSSAFATAVQGSLTLGSGTVNPGNATVSYSAYAVLITMQTVNVYGGVPKTAQTWKIIGTGTVPGAIPATLDVSAMLEQDIVNAQTYAVFATSQTCGALTINGNASTGSYNSQTMAHTPPSGSDINTTSGGNVGTNGNMYVGNNAAANLGGSLYTPRTGAGSCSSNNPDAVSGPGANTVSSSKEVHLAQAVLYPPPTAPTGVPTTDVTLTAANCATTVASQGWTCLAGVGGLLTLTPNPGVSTLSLGNVTLGSNVTLTVAGGSSEILNFNSFSLGSNASMTLTSTPNTSVTMNLAGQSLGTHPVLDLTGSGTLNTTYDSTRFQILYAGPAEMDLVGNNTVAATIYAPNAATKTTGSGQFYGSILSSTFTDGGGATLHYDTSLQKKTKTLGNYVMSSFSWRKY